jgi:hypothetical protein
MIIDNKELFTQSNSVNEIIQAFTTMSSEIKKDNAESIERRIQELIFAFLPMAYLSYKNIPEEARKNILYNRKEIYPFVNELVKLYVTGEHSLSSTAAVAHQTKRLERLTKVERQTSNSENVDEKLGSQFRNSIEQVKESIRNDRSERGLDCIVEVEKFETHPHRVNYVIRLEANDVAGGPRRIWLCEKGWTGVRDLSKELKNIKDVDRVYRWKHGVLEKKLTVPKTMYPPYSWDLKRIEGRKKQMQVFWNKFAKWVNETYLISNYDVFNSKILTDFLIGSTKVN